MATILHKLAMAVVKKTATAICHGDQYLTALVKTWHLEKHSCGTSQNIAYKKIK